MFSINANALAETAREIDFATLRQGLGFHAASYSGNTGEVTYGRDSAGIPLFSEFIDFCLSTAIPIVTAANPSRSSDVVHFEVRKGQTKDNLHYDYEDPNEDNKRDDRYLSTFITISFLDDGNTEGTIFTTNGKRPFGGALFPHKVPDAEHPKYYLKAPDMCVSVFDPDREIHAGSGKERVFYRATMQHTRQIGRFNAWEQRLVDRKLFRPPHRLIVPINGYGTKKAEPEMASAFVVT